VYRIRILDAVTRELAGLDKPVGRRILERIHRLGTVRKLPLQLCAQLARWLIDSTA
jgi:hypothetical protein